MAPRPLKAPKPQTAASGNARKKTRQSAPKSTAQAIFVKEENPDQPAFLLPGYHPDSWVIVNVQVPGKPDLYRVLAGWKGGYLQGDSWRMNSGIKSVRDADTHWVFEGYSGSSYSCHKKRETLSSITAGILAHFQKTLKESGEGSIAQVPVETLLAQFKPKDN